MPSGLLITRPAITPQDMGDKAMARNISADNTIPAFRKAKMGTTSRLTGRSIALSQLCNGVRVALARCSTDSSNSCFSSSAKIEFFETYLKNENKDLKNAHRDRKRQATETRVLNELKRLKIKKYYEPPVLDPIVVQKRLKNGTLKSVKSFKVQVTKPDANPIRLTFSPVLPKGVRSLKSIRVLSFVKPMKY
jgi:hypothetical protein